MLLCYIPAMLLCCMVSVSQAQLVPSQYVDYLPGSLNVILSSPHGGDLEPSSIPDRDAGCWVAGECVWSHTCGTEDPDQCDAVTSKDLYTQELSRELRDALFVEFGEYPATVINLLHRNKHDANREVNEATFGEPDAVEAWNYYHGLLGQLRQNATRQTLLLDIHGHGHPIDWAELGYTLSSSELDDGGYAASDTSVQSLYGSSPAGMTDIEQLIYGPAPLSFGALLEAEGFLSVPSPTNPGPDGESYFSGGYITQQYGSRDGGIVDAIQIESPRTFREDQRPEYVAGLINVVRNYLTAHYA